MKHFITQQKIADKRTIFMNALRLKKVVAKIFKCVWPLVWHSAPKSLYLYEFNSFYIWFGIDFRKSCACLELRCGIEPVSHFTDVFIEKFGLGGR